MLVTPAEAELLELARKARGASFGFTRRDPDQIVPDRTMVDSALMERLQHEAAAAPEVDGDAGV